ncbi:MAG: HAMP domain-containing histidine kinase, partial [Chloroflexota bacterium]|nr:HAMP domain-containing histidine kinase [Chloroflexota bacterium]
SWTALHLPDDRSRLQEGAVFVLLAGLADLRRLRLRHRAVYPVGTAINLAGVVVLGTPTAVWVGFLAAVLSSAWNRKPVHETAFDSAETSIAVAAGGAAFEALRRSPLGEVMPIDLPALAAYAVVNLLVCQSMRCVGTSLKTRSRPWDVIRANARGVLLPALALFPVGVLLAVAYTSFGKGPGILLLVVPFVAVYVALDRAQQLQLQMGELAKREAEAAALRELDRLKDEFLRTISHELRTPLTLVHGYAELLHTRASLPDESTQRMVARIYSGSIQLIRLVEDLLDFARIERGELAVQAQDFDLVPALRDLLTAFQRGSTAGRLTLLAPPTLFVHADPARMSQVVSNLIENAIKYAPQGRITLRARTSSDTVCVEVQDEGPGILPAEQARVWEKFYRGSQVVGQNGIPGSGIGLAVVRALVEAQGGSVGLRSVSGQGACFWIEVPAAKAIRNLEREPGEHAEQGRAVPQVSQVPGISQMQAGGSP